MALSQAMHSGPRVPLPRAAVALLVVAVWPWLQWGAGVVTFAGDALLVSLYLVCAAAGVWIGASRQPTRTGSESWLPSLAVALVLAALLSAGIGLLQWFELTAFLDIFAVENGSGERVSGNLAQPNHLATLLLLGLVAAGWLHQRARIGGRVLTAVAVVLLPVLVLTASRGGLLSLVVLAVYTAWQSRRGLLRLPVPALAAGVGVTLLLAWGLPWLSQALLVGEAQYSTGSSGRVLMWRQMLAGIEHQPWWGYGWNLTLAAQREGVLLFPGTTYTDYAHNLLLDLLIWNGVPLGLLLIAVGGWWWFTRLRAARHPDAVFALAALLPILVHSLVEYPFAYAYFLAAAALMVGVVEAAHPRGVPLVAPRPWVVLGVVAWAAVAALVALEYLDIEEDFRVTRFENLRIGKTPDDYVPPAVWWSTHLGAMLRATRTPATEHMRTEDLRELQAVSRRFGITPLNYRSALARGLNGDPEGAVRELAAMRGLYGARTYRAVLRDWADDGRRYPAIAAIVPPSPVAP